MIDTERPIEMVGRSGATYRVEFEARTEGGIILVRTSGDGLFAFDAYGQDIESGQFRLRNKTPKTTRAYRNLYTDGTCGTVHGTWEAALEYSKYDKIRVGVLRNTYEGGKLVESTVFPTKPQLRDRDNPNGINPLRNGM